ncbi:MAG TPA: thioredoxin domain-containing protein [Acidimicrobiales bacterium]|nr:thioredoxin domain-containing protein [Acidimicrobiales bacterium]
MTISEHGATPTGHTRDGGVLVGNADAPKSLVLFEDPQCPYCRQFEEVNGALVTATIRTRELSVEYRMRCFLGPESVRADNALALAAEGGRFDELRHELFAHQPEEGTGGFTVDDLLEAGAHVGLTDQSFISGVRDARYEHWVLDREARFASEDPQGTPAAWLNGRPVDSRVLFSPPAFERLLGG